MRRFTFIAALAVTIMAVKHAGALDQYAWTHRPLIVYAPASDAPELLEQRSMLSTVRDDIRERDIVLIEVIGHLAQTVVGPTATMSADDLRSRHDVGADQFAVVLVGKDTGVKLRSDEPVAPHKLFALIDAMPMRQREMQKQ